MSTYSLAIYGGAGTILRSAMSPDKEIAYTQALQAALHAGEEVLRQGGVALDAVVAAVSSLEDCPLFNAGRGAVFNAVGGHEMDASIMDGSNRMAGAVAGIQGIRNPIRLAREVMEHTEHVLLISDGAMAFADARGYERMPADYFHDDFRYAQWKEVQGTEAVQLDHTVKDRKFGTVGAVALDVHGHLAAGTSTGGMTNKKFGRVGDSPVIGAGTWAWDRTCAISCTGSGEYFLRGVVAYDVSCLMEYRGLSLEAACQEVIHKRLLEINGDGGLIAIDRQGNIALPFNTEGMYRASVRAGEAPFVGIYGD
ncbi:MAG TPA: isoaspartyl peptidase/L-asparaginase [Saprospiraceae bacterium]|nr:isoaspartyl peptidase/L-asparaginase [Saprospiraceae bacterium]